MEFKIEKTEKMKIIHIAPNSPYNDYWGYQDNLLPKYQKKLGYDVTVVITNKMYKNGKIVITKCCDYVLNDGVRIIRRRYKNFYIPTITGVLTFIPVQDILYEIKPDLIFYHGLVSYTIFDVIKYKKKNPACVIVQDNHMDYNIGNQVDTIKEKLIRCWLRWLNKRSIPYVEKIYGVTPWRCKYAEDYFKIPSCKTDLLIMGADDEKLDLKNKKIIRKKIRKQYNIQDSDFLIVTGGKIDRWKKIDTLMRTCCNMERVKLLIFGNISDEMKLEIYDIMDNNSNIIYIGWIKADKVYDYFFAADLVLFPGQHSVLWEQACASKVPCVFKEWEGMNHVNNGGNADFVSPITEDSLKEKIIELKFTDKYFRMKRIAESSLTDIYLYSHIALKSVESIANNGDYFYDE